MPEAPTMKEKKWPPDVERVLRRLHERIKSAESKLARATDDRDAWVMELREMGKDRTKARLERCADLFDALEEIKYRKFEITQCHNKIGDVMDEADQGKFEFAKWDDAEIPTRQRYFSEIVKGEAEKEQREKEKAQRDKEKEAAAKEAAKNGDGKQDGKKDD